MGQAAVFPKVLLSSFLCTSFQFLTSVYIWITWHPIIGQFCFWRSSSTLSVTSWLRLLLV